MHIASNRRRNANITAHKLDGKRIGLLTASASRLGGGVFEAVVAQAAIIKQLGGKPLIFALDDEFSAEDKSRFGDAPVSLATIKGPAQIGFAPSLLSELLSADLDCLHLHGIWQYPSRAAHLWAKRTGGAYLISPHGMLDPWITARGKMKKALARAGYERASWRAATALHALTDREAADITRESGRMDSIVIPNAGPDPVSANSKTRAQEFLYLGRIHPKKNIGTLIEAWQSVEQGVLQTGARLTIAGWGDPEDVEALQARLEGAPDTIRFIGPAFGAEKERLLASSRFLVLPSLSEGLPMAILEAWAKRTPVLMSQHCNIPAGFAAGAALDCGTTAGAIAGTLQSAMAMNGEAWMAMSAAAGGMANGEFLSSNIAGRWADCYLSSIEQAHKKRANS